MTSNNPHGMKLLSNYQVNLSKNLVLFSESLNFLLRSTLMLLLVSVMFCSFSFGQQKTLGMTKHLAGSTEKGYVLFAPMNSKTTYLIDKCGKQVHSWKSNYTPGLSVYLLPDGSLLRTGQVQDTFFSSGGKGGIIEKIDWDGKVVWSYRISNDSLVQHHDIFPMDNGNILVIAWHGISEKEALSNGRIKGTFLRKLRSERILELKPIGTNGAQVVWQWSLWDHIIQDISSTIPGYDKVSEHPELMNVNYYRTPVSDWIHMNAIHYNKDLDQILMTCHENSEVWIIDHSTTTAEAASHEGGKSGKGGDFLYRWGNPEAYNKGGMLEKKLFYPHNATWINNNEIMIFNNGMSRSPEFSSVDIITPPLKDGGYNQNLPFGPSSPSWSYTDPEPTKFYSAIISGANRLSNGNTLICSGVTGKFFEIDTGKTVVWEYMNPVANGDNILKDGQNGGSSVFRCTYYSESYSAFKNKTLTPIGPIEKNSYSYSCSLPQPDTTAPQPITFFPAGRSQKVAINTATKITFNEKVYKGSKGYLKVFENNQLKETILINDSKVTINGSIVSFSPSNNFGYNSHISISIDKGSFKDTTGNEMAAIDTLDWTFNTIGKADVREINASKLRGIYPNPTQKIIQIPYENEEPRVEIMNSVGQSMVFEFKNKTNRELAIDLSEFSNGIYSVLLNGQFSQFIVKR